MSAVGQRPRAFTLLEFILVLVIIGSLLALAAPSLRGFFDSRRTHDAAAQIVALCDEAQSLALAEGRVYDLPLDGETAKFRLPEGVTMRLNGLEGRAPAFLRFYPDGRKDVASIVLQGRQGETFVVSCESLLEPYRLRERP